MAEHDSTLHINIGVDAAQFNEAVDGAAEETAKLAWETFQPAEGTTEWYEKHFAPDQGVTGPKSNPRYYRTLMTILEEYKHDREEFDDDEAWLSCLRDQYMDTESMVARFERETLAQKPDSNGHTIAKVTAGDHR